ncbi:MAG: MarR family transcriptional regulator [Methylacidiphilales bacterium]|nr:MarR family transcriptional regulator [Candidatus Methylacidiphilales bacterium]
MQPHSTLPGARDDEAQADALPTPPVDPLLRLETFLPYRLNVLSALVLRALGRIFDDRFGLAIPDWRVIVTIGQFGTLTAKQVGAHSHMHKTKVSRAVATLERRGLLVRRSNKADLREAFLSLTEDGQAIYRDLVPTAVEFADRMLADLDAAERVLLESVLEKLTARASVWAAETPAGADDELD